MIHYKQMMFFDIETTSKFKNWEEFLLNDPNGAKSFELKYDRANSNNNQKWSGNIEDVYLRNAPILAEYGKIICISYGIYQKDQFKVDTKSIKYQSEEELIKTIVKLFNKAYDMNFKLCGHNIKEFDIPYIFKKILQYNLKVPELINFVDAKPWEYDFYDTAILTKSTSNIPSSLADITYLLNIDTPKDDISGKEVHNVYWFENNIDKICDYCEKDVVAVKEIYERIYNCVK